MSGFTPINQLRLTNVATVRLQKKGKRFEIACYRNKVLSWRNKLETDIKEVLQIDTVFTNVSKGMLASTKELQEVFGTTEHLLVCKEILDKGELQVTEQERGAMYEIVFKDIASIVADKTVNPENNRPYTTNMIQNAMRQIQYSVNVSKSSKSQALEVIRKLRDIMPIVRASMLIRIVCQPEDMEHISKEVEKLGGIPLTSQGLVVAPGVNLDNILDVQIDPENFRKIEDLIKATKNDKNRVEVLQLRIPTGALSSASANSLMGSANCIPLDEEIAIEEPLPIEKPIKSKSKSTAGKGGKKKDDLSQLLQDVTGLNLHDSENDEDERPKQDYAESSDDESYQKKTSKKKNKKNRGDDDVKDKEPSTTVDTSNSKLKLSKKDKRMEKEEKREKEQQAKLLQERIRSNTQQKQLKASESIVELPPPESSDVLTKSEGIETVETNVESTTPAVNPPSAPSGDIKIQKCNTCGGAFHDPKEYRDHFKSEWHRFNLKRKMKNLSIISSEAEFNSLSVQELQI